jgi:hypothetical protein
VNTSSPQAETHVLASYPEVATIASARRRWPRAEIAERLAELDKAEAAGESERSFARKSGTPRSTLRRWDRRREGLGLSPGAIHFFESPEGVKFLRQLMTALVFVLSFRTPVGIRKISEVLELSDLSAVVAASFGPLRNLVTVMQDEILAYGEMQRDHLAAGMKPKRITLAEDETFHPDICLVGIEPGSNYILVEEYAEHRDAETWNKAVEKALKGMPVEVIQMAGDEAKGLKAHANDSNAHHSPDVFHVQHEASRAVSCPLARHERQALRALEAAAADTAQVKEDWGKHMSDEQRRPGRPPDFAARLMAAEEAERAARRAADDAGDAREAARGAIADISVVYHPYRLSDGARQSPETVGAMLWTCIEQLHAIAGEAGLPQRCGEGIDKAGRVIDSMVDTIRFVHEETAKRLAPLQLPPGLLKDFDDRLVPSLYLDLVAARSSTASQRGPLQVTAAALIAPLRQPNHPFSALPEDQRKTIESVARACAELFQRSTSCTEGRNGQLSLFHHGLHNLSKKKLAALTVIHNYYITRSDGTTPAERFFGAPPADLFEHLVAKMPELPRPSARRKPAKIAPVGIPSHLPEAIAA